MIVLDGTLLPGSIWVQKKTFVRGSPETGLSSIAATLVPTAEILLPPPVNFIFLAVFANLSHNR